MHHIHSFREEWEANKAKAEKAAAEKALAEALAKEKEMDPTGSIKLKKELDDERKKLGIKRDDEA